MQIVPNDTLCVTVYQLQPSTAYQFMVMSRTRHGDAMYSTPIATSTKGVRTSGKLDCRKVLRIFLIF